jgi:long-chain acyl-CoA synthetase
LFDDICVLKPTMLITVPRILNRIYTKVIEEVGKKGKCVQWMFNKGMNSKKHALNDSGKKTHGCYDKMVFKKMRAKFGGNLKILITGSAPISPEILTFFEIALSIHVAEVYGQTESSAVTLSMPQDKTVGHVGGPLPINNVRLKDCPELEYLTSDKPYPRGELQFKGSAMIKGYFKNAEKTRELFDEDGWINSGDVGLILPNGAIKLVDRAKNIFKLC